MITGDLLCNGITTGHASRFIKANWLNNGKLSTIAFDLREGNPPETYVSHFLTSGDRKERFTQAHSLISKRLKNCNNGSIAILNIKEALEEINDETEPFIEFVEKGLPHCGLVYKTSNQQNIQEIKATLCLLAEQEIASVKMVIENTIDTAKLEE